MKLLVIGIDGGDEHLLRHMPVPTLHRLMDELHGVDIREDLWSRGWAHILCGAHGRESGAFYTKPISGQPGKFTQSFKGSDYRKNKNLVPLWAFCRQNELTAGFMNIPTTMPAPDGGIDGFYVAGAGAGFSGSGGAGIPDAAATPASAKQALIDYDYIFDTRFRASGIREMSEFADRLVAMQHKRTEVFSHLCAHHQPDFGFVAYMGARALQYLVLADILAVIEQGEAHTAVQREALRVYQEFDDALGQLIENVQPEQIMIVSDHAMAPYRYSMNVTPFLREIGMAAAKSGGTGKSRRLLKQVGKLLPTAVKRRLGDAAPKEMVTAVRGPDIDWQQSKAFGSRYISGIYLNDSRFAGVVDDADTTAVADEIIAAFNQTAVAREHKITARPYRRRYPNAAKSDLLPDIWLDRPDHIFFENKGPFLAENPVYGPVDSIADAPRDQYTGIKGRKPLLFVPPTAAAYAAQDTGEKDLTLAYRLITHLLTT